MGVQERAWPRGKPRREAIEEWIADEERRKKHSDEAKANPETAADHVIMNRSIFFLSRVLLGCLDGFHDDYRFEDHVFQVVV